MNLGIKINKTFYENEFWSHESDFFLSKNFICKIFDDYNIHNNKDLDATGIRRTNTYI